MKKGGTGNGRTEGASAGPAGEPGYSQKGLAKRLGCSPSLISSYETGERSPSLQNLGELADCFGVTADYLLGRTPPEPGLDLTGLTESSGRRWR